MDSVPVERVEVGAYRIPTDAPESDGTLAWDATTLVTVEIAGGGETGFGYSYAEAAAARLVRDVLAPRIEGRDALAIPGAWLAMRAALRNAGRPGVGAMALSAADAALWDLKARLLGLPLAVLLGAAHEGVPVYGSGGFTSYSEEQLCEQLAGWVAEGIPSVKMKVGRHPGRDRARVRAARRAVGDDVALMVDANGAYDRKQALAFAAAYAELGVVWLEEPVSSDDVEGLRLLRDRAPAGLQIAAGEYGFDPRDFRRWLAAGAVDVLQADATRCGGPSGFLVVSALCEAFGVPLSAHCAPSLHAPLGCAAPRFRHLEWFHDHVRIEHMLFDGALEPVRGRLHPDPARPGLGFVFKHKDAERFAL